jgi:hypothetical protein
MYDGWKKNGTHTD